MPRTHNVGGEFARHFRERIGETLCRHVNRALDAYSSSRYPDAPTVSREKLAAEIALVERVVLHVVPSLVNAQGE